MCLMFYNKVPEIGPFLVLGSRFPGEDWASKGGWPLFSNTVPSSTLLALQLTGSFPARKLPSKF